MGSRQNRKNTAPVKIVAIGGSAGALNALQSLFSELPPDCGAAFVVLQHLSAERNTLLDKILAACTAMPVQLAKEGDAVSANQIYLLPPGRFMRVEHGRLLLSESLEHAQPHKPIDYFFQSLAQSQPDRAAGVILSGTIDDGTKGLAELKESGGVTLVQDPDSADFDGMPKSAIKSGKADLVLQPADLAHAVCEWARSATLPSRAAAKGVPPPADMLDRILALVRSHARRDLRGYKKATLLRRIERRMAMLHLADMEQYRLLLENQPDELTRLAEDLLIGVTSFFRDAEAFEVLRQRVVPAICSEKKGDEPVRIWIAGCSTGEEAYSIAIEFFEWYERAGLPPKVQLFATDIDEAALEIARSGHYPAAALGHVPPDRLKRYFIASGNQYKIVKYVREAIVFAAHNLVSDPPFSKLDLLVCRNLLIYLAPETQKSLITLFRFVLNKGGHLFLGSSETVGQTRKQFEVVSKQWRIYRCLSAPRAKRPELPLVPSAGAHRAMTLPGPKSPVIDETGYAYAFRKIADSQGPTLVLIDRANEILYVRGDTAPYLDFPTGEPTRDLFVIAKPGLRLALRSAINRTRRSERKTAALSMPAETASEAGPGVRITANTVASPDRRKLLLIALEQEADAAGALPMARHNGDDWIVQQLEQELNATRDDLQRTIVKMRAGNEELKASNEEAMAMNEELQSANEELESSREELQSLNEELSTSNAILDVKVAELETVNTDLNNLLVSTELATLFLDPQFNIKRFTPACTRLMNLIPGDVGRPISDIALRFDDPSLMQDGRAVLTGEAPVTREVADAEGHWFLRRVLPYRTLDERIAGIVVTFSEVTVLKRAKEEIAQKAEELQKQGKLLQNAHILARDLDDRIIFWNHSAEMLYGWTKSEAVGRLSHELLQTQFPEPFADIKSEILAHGKWSGELVHQTREGLKIVTDSRWELYRNDEGQAIAIVEVNNDITETKQIQNRLLESQCDLDFVSHHDALTTLPNRALFRDRLKHALALAQASNAKLALLFLDVDRFKNINDSLGHEFGDQLLAILAVRLGRRLGKRDTLARTGGDEFAVLMESLDDVSPASKLAQDLIDAVKEPVQINDHELVVSISIGISLYPDDGETMDGLLKNADAAMYLAKEKGRSCYQFFTNELHRRASRFLAIETRLRRAIEAGELQLHFQPQVRIETGEIRGAEALARWTSPDLGRVAPDEFIQVAEDSGLIVPLGEWAVNTACRQLSAWLRDGIEPVPISVNVSAAQFQDPQFIAMVGKALAEPDVPPALLELELTERILLKNVDAMVAGMIALKRLGVHLSIDDFGTGYSSLSFLQRLPLDHLKVAREFLPKDPGDTHSLSIARTIITLAKSLGLRCTVEGVETETQLQPFASWGCDAVQGFLVSPALPAEEFARLLGAKPRYSLKRV